MGETLIDGRRFDLTEGILDRYGRFCTALLTSQRDTWLSVDLTMPQIKALLLIVTWQGTTPSRLARRLGVGLPSATRFVDRLAEQGFITRHEDPVDRRTVSIVPTEAARRVVDSLANYRRELVGTALTALDLEQLREVERGLGHLLSGLAASAQSEQDAASEQPAASSRRHSQALVAGAGLRQEA